MSSYIALLLIRVSLKLLRGERVPCDFLFKVWVKLTSGEWPLDRLPCFLCPRPTGGLLLRTLVSLPPSPQAWGTLNVHQPRFHSCHQGGHKEAAYSASHFFLSFFFFLVTFFISCWSRFDFWTWACFRATGTWFSYTQTWIYSSGSFPTQVLSVRSVDVPVIAAVPFGLPIW